MSKWEIRTRPHTYHADGLVIEAVKPDRAPSYVRNLYLSDSDQDIERVAREAVDTCLQLNAAEVTPLSALGARFRAAVENVKQPKPALAECVCKGVKQQAELLRREVRAAKLEEYRILLARFANQGGYAYNSSTLVIVRDRISYIEAEEASSCSGQSH